MPEIVEVPRFALPRQGVGFAWPSRALLIRTSISYNSNPSLAACCLSENQATKLRQLFVASC